MADAMALLSSLSSRVENVAEVVTRMVVVSLFGTKAILPSAVNCSAEKTSYNNSDYKPPSRYHAAIPYREGFTMRRRDIIMSSYCSLATIVTSSCLFASLPAIADDNKPESRGDDDGGVVGALKSLLDPNETSKSGKILPKAYLKSAKDVVKTLRESLKEDPKDMAKFRRTADSAKESIRDYLSNWMGKTTVASEESYVMLEKAIRSLASFYSKAGPLTPLPEEIKSEILHDLTKAEEFL